jgi:hypothetical protein
MLWCGANTGYAINGGSRVISCACQTPADFANAATADNQQWQVNSTYTVVRVSLIFKDESGNDLGGASFNYNQTTRKYAFVEGFDAKGNPLDRLGNPPGSINTSGHGSGAANGSGFGAGSAFLWSIGGEDLCTDKVTVSGDGFDDVTSNLTQPC